MSTNPAGTSTYGSVEYFDPTRWEETMTDRKWSYVHGASASPLIGETIGACLDKSVARWPRNDALVVRHQGIRWTYRQLSRHVDAAAAGLVGLGLTPGERVGIWSPNNAEWVVTQFATAKAGLILVNVNPAYRLAEVEHVLNTMACAALFVAPGFRESNYVEMVRELAPEIDSCVPGELRAKRVPTLRTVVGLGEEKTSGVLRFKDLAARGGDPERRRLDDLAGELQFDDPVNIQFTSGTTGTPKAATLTHHNVVNNALFVGETLRLTQRDRLCIPVPMYHCFGMVLGSLTSVVHGSTMVYPSAGFDPLEVLRAVEEEGCTALHGVPTMFLAELDHPEFRRFDLTSLRTGIMAGAPCPEELMERVRLEMHVPEITIAYGMTETGPVSFQTSIDDPPDRRVTTVGRVLPHIEAKIVDRDGRIVPVGTPGELLTRGYNVMRGYWNHPKLTRESIDEAGWMHTGDLATVDGEGYCRIVGRIKDVIIRGGENIFPREIEAFLLRHPKVADVQVFGVPDPTYGEEVCAWIRLRPEETVTDEEIRRFCRGQIAHFKIPRYIRFVDTFPTTVTGKIQKTALRQETVKALGLEKKV